MNDLSLPNASTLSSLSLPPAGRRLLVLFNPMAGRRHGGRFRHVLHLLAEQGCQVTVQTTTGPGHAQGLAASAQRQDYDVVVAAGGDGTINEIVNGLTADAPPLALIPMGTANVLAHELGVPLDAAAVAKLIAEGTPRFIRPGRVNGHAFVQMAGFGIDAHVVANVNRRLKRLTGKGAYVWQSMVEMMRSPYVPFEVVCDRRAIEAYSGIVSRGRFYGGRFVAARDADNTRDSFEVTLFTRPGRAWATLFSAALMTGQFHRCPGVLQLAARVIDVSAPHGQPVQVDGELAEPVPAHFELAPELIAVVAPVRV